MPDTQQSGGLSYIFGFSAANAPTISGFFARGANVDWEPEVYSTAINGEGHTEALARVPGMGHATFTGYITDASAITTLAETFSFLGYFWFVKKVGVPYKKGEFVEVTLEAETRPGVTS